MARRLAPAVALACSFILGCSGVALDPGGGSSRPPPGPGMGPGMGTGGSGRPGTMGPGMAPGSAPGSQGPTIPAACQNRPIKPGPAPLRRLTRFEYNNTVRDLLGDTSSPASTLPAEESGNGFGNDAAAQAVSSLLAEQYASVAEGIATRATQTPVALGKLAACGSNPGAGEEACARTIIEGLAPRAFRRPLAAGEADGLLALYRSTRALAGASFGSAVAAVIEALLQAPDFLYRVELGVPDRERPGLRRPSGDEMAVRLSYFLWSSMPDEALRTAARSGELLTADGVRSQATRMLGDARARRTVRFFFENLLPISGLSDLERDRMLYPAYTPAIGALMKEETQRLLEFEIFEGSGTWSGALTAPHTFVNGPLAAFYKLPGVSGMAFQKVPVEQGKRLGFLTHASLMAGTTHSNHTNPVVRGSFVAQKLLCLTIPLPDASIAEKVKPPDPYSGKTARERFTKHQDDPVCKSCHAAMDPIGFALENFDAIGLWRAQENGVTIDASGGVPGVEGTVNGAAELASKLATAEAVQTCLAGHWLQFAYGRSQEAGDECVQAAVNVAFHKAGYDIRQLLLALTQTDDFLYLPGGP
jgi:Protein of unknown function (DUF1592)/Protein of unknown function (DUF1588)/Protein of unknown function (DUF1587)/Protein of unknown function (DUF1595)/Protein of unknown function (DUF1585)